MTREEQLKYCRICRHKDFSQREGIICGLTQRIADFEEYCHGFSPDEEFEEQVEKNETEKKVILQLATKEKRFVNYIVDVIAFYLFTMLAGIFLGFVFAIIFPSSINFISSNNIFLNYLVAFTFGIIYYTTIEASTGRSVGKLLTKTRVVDVNGNNPSFSQILIRSVCRFIPFEAFSFLGSDDYGWHDKLSGTRVIEINQD